MMKQGYSGSRVRRRGDRVEKVSTDQEFRRSLSRQTDLVSLSRKLTILPRINHIDQHTIYMDYIEGHEGLTERNARQAGHALRLLHEQREYPHRCLNGLNWLIHIANENLAERAYRHRIRTDLEADYPPDALIHSEPVQFIEQPDGSIVFIDIEGIGLGTCYQDLGFIYYTASQVNHPELYLNFLAGYQSESRPVELCHVRRLAGIISLAYARFANTEQRLEFGFRLLDEACYLQSQ